MARPRNRRRKEGGFALLLVFLMASVAAITLYLEIPRVAMESERAKEQLLIDRGEQYKRAIQLFTRKAGRYPARIEELENFQNMRFLRKRYIDPVTGKEEWRLVHIQNGILTDSKVTRPQKQDEEKKNPSSFGEVENTFGSGTTGTTQGGAQLARERRRPSDSGTAGSGPELPPLQHPGATGAGAPTIPGQTPSGDDQQNPANPMPPGQPVQAGQAPPVPGVMTPAQPVGGSPGQVPQIPGLPGQPGFPGSRMLPGQQPIGMPGSNPANTGGGSSFGGTNNSFGGGSPVAQTGLQSQPGQPNYNPNGQPLPPYANNPATGPVPGIGRPGTNSGAGNQSAADMINRILTTPNPNGMPAQVTGGAALGGGIAGVASTGEGDAIMVYNDRSAYQEWEFIYDPQKEVPIPNPNATGAGGTPADRLGRPAGQGSGGVGQQPGMNLQPTPNSGGNSFGTGNSFNPVQTPQTPTTPRKQ